MTPERWERIVVLFEEARERPVVERTRFLESAALDGEMRGAVEQLLRADASAFPLLDGSPRVLAAAVSPRLSAPRLAGQRVGPYTLVRELGRGGMGVVYLADREDLEKLVALKLVSGGLASPDRIERFLLERRVLAQLAHPHIAGLLDAGVTDDRTPWFAMEYIEGEPIDGYCDSRRLAVADRLALFEQVCEAVSYAHQNLIVHRDLKPSNILVTRAGRVKLLDFGIAKLLESPSDDAAALTRTGVRALTPEYAAPEQLRGGRVTTATDVYGLGVLLYELLTGQRPHAGAAREEWSVEHAILEREVARPSSAVVRTAERREGAAGRAASPDRETIAAARATTVARLRRQLRGDLDTIVLKSLAKEPERRYPTAERLLDDLRRHRRGLPVAARPDTVVYRAAKFVRRHRAAVVAASLGVLSIVLGLAAALWEQGRAARERDIARRERDKARRVVEFITGVLAAADPGEARGDTLNVYDLLARSERGIDTALANQPEAQADLWNVVGQVYSGLGEYEHARLLLERALAARRKALGDQHPDVAESAVELGVVLRAQGDYQRAERLVREALSTRRALFGEAHAEVAATLNVLAEVLYYKGEYARAAEMMREALAVNRRHGADSGLVATSLVNLAETLRPLGQLEEAERMFKDALRIRRAVLGNDHPLVPATLTSLAALLRDLGDYAEAESLLREALATRRAILGAEHPDVASTLTALAYVLHWQGDYAGAEPLYRQALAIDRQRRGPDNQEVAMDLFALAAMLHDRGGADAEAEQLYRSSLGVMRRVLPPKHARLTMPLTGLGGLLVARRRAAEAEPLLREAVALRESTMGDGHPLTAVSRSALGACLTALGRYAEAEPLLLRSQVTMLRPQRPGRPEPRRLEELGRVRERLLALYLARLDQAKAAEYRALLTSDSLRR